MKTVVWKYVLPIEDIISLEIPKDAELLTVQMQFDFACLWVMVNPDNEIESRSFRLLGTGHEIYTTIPMKYINTFQVDNGRFVFHLFELTSPTKPHKQ